jgi:hypothetical protein
MEGGRCASHDASQEHDRPTHVPPRPRRDSGVDIKQA